MTARRRSRVRRNRRVSFRLMMQEDLPEVFAIEAEAFVQPWSEADFYDVLNDPDTVALVVERDAAIVGYILTGWKNGWVRILSCAVTADCRRQGIGTRMIAPLVEAQENGQCKGVLVKVSERNLIGQLFFRSRGFRAVRILQGWLFDGGDVYVMQHSPLPPPDEIETYTWPEDELIPLWEAKHA